MGDFERYKNILAPVVAELRGLPGHSLLQRPDLFGGDQKNYRSIGSPLDSARWAGHLLTVDEQPAVVAALTILPNVDKTLLKPGQPYVLLSVNIINEDYLKEMGRGLLLPDLSFGLALVGKADTKTVPLETDDGLTAGQVSWQTERPGRSLISIILPLVTIGFLAVAVAAHIMLQRLRNTSTHLALEEKRSRHAAKHDALSGLPNRAHFAEHLETVLADLDPSGPKQHAIVAYLDVDRFKEVNDTLGHSAGDGLIREVANRLRAHVRSGDIIARYGGDEFAIRGCRPIPMRRLSWRAGSRAPCCPPSNSKANQSR